MQSNWPNVLRVARWEFSKGARSPMFLFMTILVPAIIAISGGAGFFAERMQSERAVDLAVVDETGSFEDYLQPAFLPDAVRIQTLTRQEEEARALLDAGDIHAYVLVNDDGLRDGRLPLLASDLRRISPNQIRDALRDPVSVYRLDQLGMDSEAVMQAVAPLSMQVQEIRDGEAADLSIGGMLVPMAVAVVLILSALLSGQVLMYGVIREKRNRVVEILLSSVSSLDLLLGKILGVGGLSLLQIGLWVAVGIAVGSRFLALDEIGLNAASLVPSLLFFFFGYFLLASIFAALGAAMKEAEESSQAQGLVVLIPVAPLFVSGMVAANPDALWAVIASHIPPFIPTMVLLRMAVMDVPLWEMATTLTALILSIIAFVYVGARIFESGILQYHRALGLKDMGAVLRRRS